MISIGRGKSIVEEETNRTDSSLIGSSIGIDGGANGPSELLFLPHD